MNIPAVFARKLQPLLVLWAALSPRRRRQLLGLQLLSFLAAAGEVANLGALLPFLRLLANPQEGLRALGPLAAPLRSLPEQHLLLRKAGLHGGGGGKLAPAGVHNSQPAAVGCADHG
jgi:hypothetical protein